MNDKELMDCAIRVRENAYAPYSHFAVGAALLSEDGKVYVGCNVENASFSATCCAERVAFGRALADGARRFSQIAVVGGRKGCAPSDFVMPCGICRQVMTEFCGADFEILVTNGEEIRTWTLGELMPGAFRL